MQRPFPAAKTETRTRSYALCHGDDFGYGCVPLANANSFISILVPAPQYNHYRYLEELSVALHTNVKKKPMLNLDQRHVINNNMFKIKTVPKAESASVCAHSAVAIT